MDRGKKLFDLAPDRFGQILTENEFEVMAGGIVVLQSKQHSGQLKPYRTPPGRAALSGAR